jgi:hypothetical protein
VHHRLGLFKAVPALAIFAAIRRASSLVSSFALAKTPSMSIVVLVVSGDPILRDGFLGGRIDHQKDGRLHM